MCRILFRHIAEKFLRDKIFHVKMPVSAVTSADVLDQQFLHFNICFRRDEIIDGLIADSRGRCAGIVFFLIEILFGKSWGTFVFGF